MTSSDVLLIVNIVLFIILLVGAALWVQDRKLWRLFIPGATSTTSASPDVMMVATDPMMINAGPTVSETTEVGIINPVTPISPSWPYADFPRSAPGSIRWSQSSLDSVPYFGGKLHGHPMQHHHCTSCSGSGSGSGSGGSLKEGMDDGTASDAQRPGPVTTPEIPPKQTDNPLPTSGMQPEDASAADVAAEKKKTIEVEAPSSTQIDSQAKTTSSTPPSSSPTTSNPETQPTSTSTTEVAASTSADKSQPDTTSTKPVTAIGVQGNGSDVLTGKNKTLVNSAVSSTTKDASSLKSGTDLTPSPSNGGTDFIKGAKAEKQPVLPASAFTETVQQRLKLMQDVSTQGQGSMAQELYLMKLLEQHRANSSKQGNLAQLQSQQAAASASLPGGAVVPIPASQPNNVFSMIPQQSPIKVSRVEQIA